MPFQALTGAPILRDGVTLNIMPYPQIAGTLPERLAPGARVTVRFGNCCPLIKEARITGGDDDLERLSLVLEGTAWTLEQRSEGVSIPGIVSQNWIVRPA